MRAARLLQPSSKRSFESLYRRHLNDVYGYSLALLDRPADAEDATQATFLNAYRAFERGERPRDPGSWLRTIALNVCREHWRRASRRPNEVSLEEDPGELVADEPTPAIGEVIRALSKLPFNQRAALVMREFEGRSLGEIATALEVSPPAVESLLFRGRRALREQLDGSIRCHQAEELISRQLDGRLGYRERGQLRAHLRECSECAVLARRLRAQRKAIKSLALVPVPAALMWSKFAGSGAPAAAAAPAAAPAGGSLLGSLATPVAMKAVGAVILAGALVGGGYAAVRSGGGHAASAGGSAGSSSAAAAAQALNGRSARRAAAGAHQRGAKAVAAAASAQARRGGAGRPGNSRSRGPGRGTTAGPGVGVQTGSSTSNAARSTGSSGAAVRGGGRHGGSAQRYSGGHGHRGTQHASAPGQTKPHPANPNGPHQQVPPPDGGGRGGQHGH